MDAWCRQVAEGGIQKVQTNLHASSLHSSLRIRHRKPGRCVAPNCRVRFAGQGRRKKKLELPPHFELIKNGCLRCDGSAKRGKANDLSIECVPCLHTYSTLRDSI
jgi:hypothetical protein